MDAPHHIPSKVRIDPRSRGFAMLILDDVGYVQQSPDQNYHFGPGRIADYLERFHQLTVAVSSVHRILVRHDMNRLPASQKHRSHAHTPSGGSAPRNPSRGNGYRLT